MALSLLPPPSVLLLFLTALATANGDKPQFDPPLTPTPVYVFPSLIAIGVIDAVAQTFSGDLYNQLFWRDDRLANVSSFDPMLYWSPLLELTNGDASANVIAWTFTIGPITGTGIAPPGADEGVWVNGYARMTGTFSQRQSLVDFPQDVQSVAIRMESSLYDVSALTFISLPTQASQFYADNDFATSVVGWSVLDTTAATVEHYYPAFASSYSQLALITTVQRESMYYFTKVVVNVVLLVTMALIGSTLRVDVPERSLLTMAAFGVIVSYIFILVESTPKTGTSTRLDAFMTLSFFCVFTIAACHAGEWNYAYVASVAA